MKTVNKITSALLSILLTTGLFSCTKPEPDPTPEAQPSQTESTESIESPESEETTPETEPAFTLDMENFTMQEPTDKLTLYSYTMNSHMITPAVEIFNELYPDVEVEVINYSDDDYKTIISTELPAGKGPDLILAQPTDIGGDIYKSLSADLFVDLNQLILRDDSFTLDGYVEEVMNAGILGGKRLVMPVEYGILPLVTAQEILDGEGISAEDITTFGGFLSAARQYNENHKDSGDCDAFSMGDKVSFMLKNFMTYSGLRLIDYENNTISIDEGKFRDIIDYIKDAPKKDPPDMTDAMAKGLIDGRNLFDNSVYLMGTIFIMSLWQVSQNGMTPVTAMWRNIDDGVSAEVINAAAIPKASKNQINAYRFLKILLSEEIQGGNSSGITYLRFGHPVLESSLRAQMENDFSKSAVGESMGEDWVKGIVDSAVNVDCASLGTPPELVGFVEEAMTPYINGTKTYEECYDKLVNMLELYKEE